jgi:hypothetical protein
MPDHLETLYRVASLRQLALTCKGGKREAIANSLTLTQNWAAEGAPRAKHGDCDLSGIFQIAPTRCRERA